jgi:hypothetical protein
MKSIRTVGGLSLAALMTLGVPALTTSSAHAQMRFSVTSSLGGASDGQVSKRSVERYADLLGFSPEQKDSALTIHEGYAAAFQQAQKARRTAMEDLRRSTEDTDDHTAFMQKMPGIEKDFRDKTSKLNKGFFDDLKGLVSPAQDAKWIKVERMRRRETGLKGGVSGEAVDLVDVVDGLKLPSDAMTAVAPTLDEYESELDHQLQDKAKAAADAPGFEPGKFDAEKLQQRMKEARESGLKVKQVNERSARKIEPLLPEDKRASFRSAVRERSFPQVYRPSRATRDMDAALKLDDLSPAQRSQIQDMKAAYQRDVTPLNDAWAAAITESEGDGQSGAMVGSDGSHMMLSLGDDPKPLVDARKARREFDDKANDKLKGILNQDQQGKLAKARSNEPEDMMGGEMRAIMISNDR